MQMMISRQIGHHKYTFVLEGVNLFELVMEAEKIGFHDIYECGKCGEKSLRLRAYKTKEKGFKYTKVECNKCHAGLTFGQRKDDPNVFYFRKDEDGKLAWEDAPKGSKKAEDDEPFG